MIGLYLGIAVSLAGVQQKPELTLDEALAIASQDAFAIRLAQSDIAEAKANKMVADAALGPTATLSGTSFWSEAHTPGGFGQNGQNTSNSISLSVRQIIDISKVNTLRADASEIGVKISEYAKQTALNDLRAQVKSKFFAALQAKELVQIRNAAVAAAKERLDKAQIRFENKAIPKFDVLRLQADLKKAEQDLVQAKGGFEVAKQDLNNLLARPVDTDYDPVGSTEFESGLEDISVYVRASLANRPELLQAEAVVLSLTKIREAEQRAALPTLTLQAGHTQTIDPGFGQPERQTTASATLSVPIVTGGAIRANTQRAREQEERAKILLQQAQLGVAFEVRIAVTQFETALAAYATAVENRNLAEEALRLAQLRYDEEVGILLDVITAQADLTAAESSQATAAFQLRAAYASLQRAVGTDDLKNLPPPPASPAAQPAEEGGQ